MGTNTGVKENDFFDVKISVVISLLSWPICYFINTGIATVDEDKRTLVLMSAGFVLLATIVFIVKTLSKLKNWIGYEMVKLSESASSRQFNRRANNYHFTHMILKKFCIITPTKQLTNKLNFRNTCNSPAKWYFAGEFFWRVFSAVSCTLLATLILFAFTSMIDLIIAIEFKGWISGFMTQYLEIGEPYLSSPWGYAITLFDGLCLYIMYLMLIHRISNGKPWRNVGIYWVSALFNSMIVLLFGVATGKHSPTFCTFLNVPYAIVPIIIAIRLFSKEKQEGWSVERVKSNGFFLDLIVVIGLVFSIWLIFVKGMLSIGSQFKIFQDILSHERALLDVDPAPFAILQSLVYLFYSLPILGISLACIFCKRKPQFLWDLALINGGLILQGQFSFIVTALDSQTSEELRSQPLDWQFWVNNLTLLAVPQVLLWYLYRSNVEVTGGTKKGKKE